MKLCVIGDPVGHSMSPVLHRRMLALSGIEGDYQAVTVTRETLPDFIAAGRAGEWDGCNVTMPLKQEVIRYLDKLSPEAEACGAVNTVCFRNGHTVGYNTDAPGIRAGFAARGAAPTGRALVIGNGEMGRLSAALLHRLGCAVTVTLRTYRHGGTEHSRRHASSRTYYYATFQVESGDRMELEVPDREHGRLAEGDRGRLTFQGTRFQGFRRT